MSKELNKADQDREANGSRDRMRALLKEAQDKLWAAAEELGRLRDGNRKEISYRYADADLGIAIATVEKVRIVMRKRKRSEKQIEAKATDGQVPPQAPIEAHEEGEN